MTSTRTCRTALFLFAMAAIFGTACRAEALFVPIVPDHMPIDPVERRPDHRILPPPMPQTLPFRITSSRVDVRIDDNVATTSMEQAFLNMSGQNLEVRVLIPLPAGAAINNSSLSMNDQMVEGKLYDSAQAQSIYESIVIQRRDPALLRYAGENLFEARVFPIPPNQERRLKFSFTQVLSSSGGLYDYRHILSGSTAYSSGIEKFRFECVIHSKTAIGPVYSPTHQVNVERPSAQTASIKLSGDNVTTDRDLRIYFAPSVGDVAMRLITHRSSENDDGYFMLLGRADDQLDRAHIMPKEIVFVIDRSGSMQGEKIQQCKNALKYCLNSLSEGDRFNLITFSTDVEGLSSNKLIDASKENINKALAAVDQIEASGGTNIDDAMRAALGSDFSSGSARAKTIVFMTDGCPTVGVTDMDTILKDIQKGNQTHKVRIFNFGVGNDVNTHLLDKMALDQDGVTAYVAPKEDIEIKVSDFFSKIKHPVMTDVAFDFGTSSGVNSVYPKKIPALYRGGEVMIFGRYKGASPGEIVLTGNVGGEARRIPVQVEWPSRNLENSYLPRVWAMRKIGHLIEDVRLHGQNQEIIREIVELAHRHGIVTPYTSQLVLEPGMQPQPFNGGPAMRGAPTAANMDRPALESLKDHFEMRERAADAAKSLGRRAEAEQVGETANALAETERDLKEASRPDSGLAFEDKSAKGDEKRRKQGAAYKAGIAGSESLSKAESLDAESTINSVAEATIRQAGTRTFYNRGGVWVDSSVKADAKPIAIKTFSKEYFELMKKDASLGAVLALGGRILVQVHESVYQIE